MLPDKKVLAATAAEREALASLERQRQALTARMNEIVNEAKARLGFDASTPFTYDLGKGVFFVTPAPGEPERTSDEVARDGAP